MPTDPHILLRSGENPQRLARMDSVIQFASRLDSFGELNTTSETLCSILDISFSLGSMNLAKGLSSLI